MILLHIIVAFNLAAKIGIMSDPNTTVLHDPWKAAGGITVVNTQTETVYTEKVKVDQR